MRNEDTNTSFVKLIATSRYFWSRPAGLSISSSVRSEYVLTAGQTDNDAVARACDDLLHDREHLDFCPICEQTRELVSVRACVARKGRTIGGRNVLRESSFHLVSHSGEERSEVARKLVAHDRDVKLVVEPGPERVPQLEHLRARTYLYDGYQGGRGPQETGKHTSAVPSTEDNSSSGLLRSSSMSLGPVKTTSQPSSIGTLKSVPKYYTQATSARAGNKVGEDGRTFS